MAFGKSATVFSSPNISVLNIIETHIKKNEDELRLVFFSRITQKKNLFFVLERLKNFTNKNIILDIYGSIEDKNYWIKCKNYIQKNNIKANFISALKPSEVQSKLSNYHFFIFPTLHENYGHVIAEALSSGCGLIISTNTPWRNLERNTVGWDIELSNKQSFIDAIDTCYRMDQEEYNTYRNNCYRYIADETSKQNAIELTRKMFLG